MEAHRILLYTTPEHGRNLPKSSRYIGVEKERDNITHNGPQWGGSGGLCGVPSVMANSLVYIRQT